MTVPREQGAALVTTLLAMTLLMALGLALVLTSMTEARIASAYRDGAAALYAAEAGLARAIADVRLAVDIDALLDGRVTSTFVDGGGGIRPLPGGGVLDLNEATALMRCGQRACDAADLVALSAERPWGRNNPVWQLYAHGALRDLIPEVWPAYLVVWIGDDPSERDDRPLVDSPDLPGRGLVVLRAHGYGSGGARRAVEAVVAWPDRVVSWRELR